MEPNKNSDPVSFVDWVLSEALALEASDIYFIPRRELCSIRCRVGGVQRELCEIRGSEFIAQCASRIKVLSGMLTYRRKISQDGSIRGIANFANAELRVSAMPTIHGERISIRVLGGGKKLSGLDDLGFSTELLSAIRRMLDIPCGLTILTGPTGCGKTTTIYAMIHELLRNSQDPASIISIEDPVEMEIDGISQVSLTRSAEEWGYEEALRAALRQDVKTLVVGEIRDLGVAKMVLNAALSGHRVITTIHAGDIASVYARLLHHGLEPFLIASAISGVITQRLVLSSDGRRRLPVAAYLIPDDSWRDYVVGSPGLADLRRKMKDYPSADLKATAMKAVEEGLIQLKDAMLL